MNSRKDLLTYRSGFTIIELMVAIALAAVLGSVLIGMVLQSQSLANSAKLKSQASSIAEQYVEQARSAKTTLGWTAFVLKAGDSENCYVDAVSFAPGNCSTGNQIAQQPVFSAAIGLKTLGSGVLATAYVYYMDRGNPEPFSVKSSTFLTDIK